MGRPGIVAALLALLVLSPGAQAGTEADPEVPGVRDKADPGLDFLGAWLEERASGLVFTVKVGGLPKAPVDRFYGIMFTLDGVRLAAVVAFDARGAPHSDVRAIDFNGQGLKGPERLAGSLEDVELRTGSPAYVSARIPWGATAGFTPGKTLEDLGGATGTYERARQRWVDADWRNTEASHVLERVFVPLALRRHPVLFMAGAALALALAGGGVAWLLQRRRGPRPPTG